MCRDIRQVNYITAGQPQEYKKPLKMHSSKKETSEIFPNVNLEITVNSQVKLWFTHIYTYTYVYLYHIFTLELPRTYINVHLKFLRVLQYSDIFKLS